MDRGEPDHSSAGSGQDADPSRVWLPIILEKISIALPPNWVPYTLRLVNKATAAQLRDRQHTIIRLSLPSPHHAFVSRWGHPGAMRSLNIQQRRKLVCLTAASGSLDNLQVAVEMAGLVLQAVDMTGNDVHGPSVFKAAAAARHLHVCQWLRQSGCPWSWALAAVAEAGNQAGCEWMLAAGYPWEDAAVYGAARGGHVGLAGWLLEQHRGPSWDVDVGKLLAAAAEGCDLAALQRLHQEGRDGRRRHQLNPDEQEAILGAAAASLTCDWQDKVRWLEERGYPRTAGEVCKAAAARPDALERLRWLRGRGYRPDEDVTREAARADNWDALQYLLAEGVPVDWRGIAEDAAEGGKLAALQDMYERGYDMDPVGIIWAASRGAHLAVVAWAVETWGATPEGQVGGGEGAGGVVGGSEVKLGAHVFNAAAESGSVELLEWLHGRGCSWGPQVLGYAASSGCEEALVWLVARGCPVEDDGRPYVNAIDNGDLAVMRCLHRLGVPWGPDDVVFPTCTAQEFPLPALRWLLEAGCPVSWGAGVWAAGRRRGPDQQEVLGWMRGGQRRALGQ